MFPTQAKERLAWATLSFAWATLGISFGMDLVTGFKNVAARRVFGAFTDVSGSDMRIASLTLADTTCNENILVAQGLKRHDPELLDQLIVQYQHRLLRYLLYLTGNRETAEDIFQETWMRVMKRGDQFNGKSRFDTWLFTIARNLVIDVRRKRTMSSLEAMREAGEDGRSFDVPADGPSPFEMYQSAENGQRVAEALLTLEPLHREVLVLRFHEELSLEEIAQVTRSPLSTVKSRLYRGLSALKPRMHAAEACIEGEAR